MKHRDSFDEQVLDEGDVLNSRHAMQAGEEVNEYLVGRIWAEQLDWDDAIHDAFAELDAVKAELAAIHSSRAWQLAQAGSLAAKAKRRVQR